MDLGDRAPHPDHTASFTVVFEDSIGQRFRAHDLTLAVERLHLRSSFAAIPAFEFALRERVARLASAQVPGLVRALGVERRESPAGGPELVVVSEAVEGVRLSTFMAGLSSRGLTLDIHAGLALLRQVVSTVSHLHHADGALAHGALGPDRLLIGPQGRVLLAEPMLAPALEALRYPHERYWTELQVPLPTGEPLRVDQRADVLQLGMTALALIHGRPVGAEQFPRPLAELVTSTWALSADGGVEPLPPGLRGWMRRALQLEADASFSSAVEAHAALGLVLGDGELLASTFRLRTLLARYQTVQANSPSRTSTLAPIRPELAKPAEPIEHVVALAAPWRPDADGQKPFALVKKGTRQASAGTSVPRSDDWSVEPDEEPAPVWRRWRWVGAAAVVVAVMAAGVVVAAHRYSAATQRAMAGTLVLTTMPAGVDAFIDGDAHGPTPLTVQLAPGTHRIELKATGMRKTLDITVQARQKITQMVKLTKTRPAVKGARASSTTRD